VQVWRCCGVLPVVIDYHPLELDEPAEPEAVRFLRAAFRAAVAGLALWVALAIAALALFD
jgi:hypothetical protein